MKKNPPQQVCMAGFGFNKNSKQQRNYKPVYSYNTRYRSKPLTKYVKAYAKLLQGGQL